jgi:CheY-like chemotaxis protein
MNRRHILLAEDDPREAELTLDALRANNLTHAICVVRDGEEVLDYLYCRGKFLGREGGNPFALVLDLMMPKISGLEALKVIKADEHLKTIPVVILTSSREPTDLTDCYEYGANAYVVKPMDFGEFSKVVSQLGVFWATVNEPPPTTKTQRISISEQSCP